MISSPQRTWLNGQISELQAKKDEADKTGSWGLAHDYEVMVDTLNMVRKEMP